jgi:hypothetical protein
MAQTCWYSSDSLAQDSNRTSVPSAKDGPAGRRVGFKIEQMFA